MNIVNPIDNNQYSIFSKTGRTLLKLYLRNFKNGGDITFEKMLNSPDELTRSINQLYNSNLKNSQMMMESMRDMRFAPTQHQNDQEKLRKQKLLREQEAYQKKNLSFDGEDIISAICDETGYCY